MFGCSFDASRLKNANDEKRRDVKVVKAALLLCSRNDNTNEGKTHN